MKSRLLYVVLLLPVVFPTFASSHTQPEFNVAGLTVSIFNDAEVPPSVLAEAESRASFVLRRARLDVSWMDCGFPGNRVSGPGCNSIAFPQHLSLRLVSTHGGLTQDTFGQAYQNAAGEGAYVVVYFGILSASKVATTMHSGDLLGLVIAHELGHLLLGLQSHSATGLMSPVWQADEIHQAARGNLFFTDAQQGRIRSRYFATVARLNSATAPSSSSSGK
ncbi:MAG TPA: hypothetical protein VGF20_05895 [Candidatus Acidoferrum sp.]